MSKKRNKTEINFDMRKQIQFLKLQDVTNEMICEILNMSRPTLYKELRRSSNKQYSSLEAQLHYENELRNQVEEKIKKNRGEKWQSE